MIRYKRNVIKMMAEKRITTYIIRKEKLFAENQLGEFSSCFIKHLPNYMQEALSEGQRAA